MGIFEKLRADAARFISIDPDRIKIEPASEAYHFEVTVEGDLDIVSHYRLREFLNQHSPVWARWRVSGGGK